MPKKTLPATAPVAQTVAGPPVTGGRSTHCQCVSFRASSDATQEKRRSSPPALAGSRARTSQDRQSVHGEDKCRQRRDRSAPKLRHGPECSVPPVRFLLGLCCGLGCCEPALPRRVRALAELRGCDGAVLLAWSSRSTCPQDKPRLKCHQQPQPSPPALPQPLCFGIEGARNQEHTTVRTAAEFVSRDSVGEPGLLPKLCCMLSGFLLCPMMLTLLVAGCVLPALCTSSPPS